LSFAITESVLSGFKPRRGNKMFLFTVPSVTASDILFHNLEVPSFSLGLHVDRVFRDVPLFLKSSIGVNNLK
jgi:hypothetical protein